MQLDPEKNKIIAREFYKMAFNGNPKEAAELYAGKEYKRHNSDDEGGIDGFIAYFERMFNEYPGKSMEIVFCDAAEDLVILHVDQIWPENLRFFLMVFFRFDKNNKIVEYWDIIEKRS